jgi:hypothetical protein
MFAGRAARIEAAAHSHWSTSNGAPASCDGAEVDVAVIDVPAIGAFGVSTAGEGGHP